MARRSFWTNVTIITATLTLIGGVASSIIAVSGDWDNSRSGFERDICKAAYDTLADDTPNPDLLPAERRQFVVDQLKLARKCALRIK